MNVNGFQDDFTLRYDGSSHALIAFGYGGVINPGNCVGCPNDVGLSTPQLYDSLVPNVDLPYLSLIIRSPNTSILKQISKDLKKDFLISISFLHSKYLLNNVKY